MNTQREIDWYNRLFLRAEGEKNMSAGTSEHRFSIPSISFGLFTPFRSRNTGTHSPVVPQDSRAKPSRWRERAQIHRVHYTIKTYCVSLQFFFLGLPLCCLNVYMEQLRKGGCNVVCGLRGVRKDAQFKNTDSAATVVQSLISLDESK